MTPRERFTALNADKRKLVIFALAIAAALCFLLMPSLSSLLPFTHALQSRKASPQAAPGIITGAVAARASQGVWQGQALIPRGLCTLELEIREKQEGQLAGYSSLTCIPLRPSAGAAQSAAAAAMLGRLAPTSAILTGVWENGAIKFHVDKNIGMNPSGSICAMRAFTATPFGSSQISTEWEDPACGDGQIMVRKVRQ
jgi:hypothetical protein